MASDRKKDAIREFLLRISAVIYPNGINGIYRRFLPVLVKLKIKKCDVIAGNTSKQRLNCLMFFNMISSL